MASRKQIAANRRNALKSTGPRTAVGKVRSSTNAVTHGLTASLRPLPGLEDGTAWEAHLAATIETLAPEGHLERLLATRIAVQAWRLGRVVMFESELGVRAQEDAEHIVIAEAAPAPSSAPRSTLAEMELELENTRAAVTIVKDLRCERDVKGKVARDVAWTIIGTACRLAQRGLQLKAQRAGMSVPEILGIERDDEAGAPESFHAREILDSINQVVEHDDSRATADGLLFDMQGQLQIKAGALEEAIASRQRALAEYRCRNMLPDRPTLEGLSRYEAHLERSLIRVLHEFQRLQARRRGEHVAPPVAVDLTAGVGG